MSKAKIGALFAALTLAVLSVTAYAAEDESEVDLFGNSVREEYEEKEVEGTGSMSQDEPFFTNPESIVELANGTEYDKDSQLYIFRNGASVFYSEVPDGMIQKSSVYLYKGNLTEYRLYKDGAEIEFEEEITVQDAGDYAVVRGGSENAKPILKFTIAEDLTSKITGYQMPYGYKIKSATLNGEQVSNDGKYISFMKEGTYEVAYENEQIEVENRLKITTDFTPPELLLEAVNDKGYASGPVSLEDYEKGDTITILLNGKAISMPLEKILTETGSYQITLSDKAGNASNYSFVIKPYLNVSAVVVIIAAVALLAAFIVFVVRNRKYVRVR